MHAFKVEFCLKSIFVICFISIIAAYFIEYILGHQPCNLCLMERIPYVLSLILIILNYIFIKNERFILLLLILLFAFSFIISFYHFGIEQGSHDPVVEGARFSPPLRLLPYYPESKLRCAIPYKHSYEHIYHPYP